MTIPEEPSYVIFIVSEIAKNFIKKLIYHNIILATKTWGYHKFTTGISDSTDNFLLQRDCDQDFPLNNKMTVPDVSR